MDKKELTEKVKGLGLPEGEYAVFGSGPMVVRGMREGHDIDLLVTSALEEELRQRGWKGREGKSGLEFDVFETATTWDYGEYNPDVARLIREAEIIDGVPFVKLEEVLAWKKAFGREKDKKDIELIGKPNGVGER